jgi:perosamine synthetase
MKPWLGDEEADAIRDVVKSGWICTGPKVTQFEGELCALVGAEHGVATNAATSALHLALQVHGLQRGDEVILPSFTCMANANAVIIAGGVPKFADIERDTYNLNPQSVEEQITDRTRAIMMVDQIGLPADLDAFRGLAEAHNLILVEDAATALGSRYKGKLVGGHGVTTCYSFHPRKLITTGEGGMMMTADAALAERARILRSAGASISDLKRHQAKGALFQEYAEYGYNYRMTDMQAAMGIVQLSKFDAIVEQRLAQANLYNQLLADVEEVAGPFVPSYANHSYTSYCVRTGPGTRVTADDIVRRMAHCNVSCRRGIQPLHLEPYFSQTMHGLVLPETELAAKETFFLPIFPGLTEGQQRAVVEALKYSIS